MRAIGQTLFPRGGAIAADGLEAGVVDYIEDYLLRLPAIDQWQLRLFFRAFDLGYAVTARRPGARFHSAGPAERHEYLTSWENSPRYAQRMGFQGLKMVFTLAYAEASTVKAAMGVEPDEQPAADLEAALHELASTAGKVG